MSRATSVFEKQAATYGGPREKLIPQMDRFYGSVAEMVGTADGEVTRILDLGAGTGILSAVVMDSFPKADFTLTDFSPRMLAQAEEALGGKAEVVVGDLYEGIPEGPWDAVISALAIHHMTDHGKRDVYDAAFRQLRSGGVFVNAEHILGETPDLQEYYAEWHRRQAFDKGLTDEEWTDTVERMSHDHLAPLSVQLGWLQLIGFTDIHTPFKDHGFAVMAARKP